MEDLFLDEDEDQNEDLEIKDNKYNYKGYFVENGEEEKKFYEFGAHFPYMFLYQKLEIIAQEREEKKKILENKLKQIEKEKENEKEKESRDDQGTKDESKINDNLKDKINNFQQRGKSRNGKDAEMGITYISKMNKNNNNYLNIIENIDIKLVKSTLNKNHFENIDKKSTKIKINNNINNASNIKNNNINNKNKNKSKKNVKKSYQHIKIIKRKNNKNLNINNILNNKTTSLNIYNQKRLGDSISPKNIFYNKPYMSKIKNNLEIKFSSIQSSKQKL